MQCYMHQPGLQHGAHSVRQQAARTNCRPGRDQTSDPQSRPGTHLSSKVHDTPGTRQTGIQLKLQASDAGRALHTSKGLNPVSFERKCTAARVPSSQ